MGWFAYLPEWCDTNYTNFAQSEAQSVSLFVHYLSNEQGDAIQSGSKGNGCENENILVDVVIILFAVLEFTAFGFGAFISL